MITTADTLGLGGVFTDPLWRIRVDLTPVEQDLLGAWWVRRLGFVNHAGAASVATTQSYTRLEHSLGLLALVSHFTPGDHLARVAALLHDVGHLPFSHTIEGLNGLDHHILGRQRIQDLAPILERHHTDPQAVIDTVEGRRSSGLRGPHAGLRLDHLDSFLRSGQAHGRTVRLPSETLRDLRLVDGVIDTDRETACYLSRLVIAEARAQASTPNLVAVAVLRDLAERVLHRLTPPERDELTAMTDDEFWALVLSHPASAADARRLRQGLGFWRTVQEDEPPVVDEIRLVRRRYYLELPTVHGEPMPPVLPPSVGLPGLPHTVRVVAVPTPAAGSGPDRPETSPGSRRDDHVGD